MVSPRKRQLKIDEEQSSIQAGRSESSSNKRQELPKAGLVRPEEVRVMMESSRNERARNLASDGAAQGETVHRVGGRVVSEAEWRESRQLQDPKYRKERQRELDREFSERQEKEAGWGRGMEQSSDRLRKAEEAARFASLPIGLSSSAQESINRSRWDDPLNRIKSEYVSPVATSSKPISMYQAPSNRFNIRAGYRWDGVVRGTNYEQRWFERQNESRNVGDFTND
jgi:pre-mRNA-splicing factor CWC26